MSYSRRDFLKAAGSGIVLTAVNGDAVVATAAADPRGPRREAICQAPRSSKVQRRQS